VQHPHVVQLYEIIETPKKLYLIMEFASGGELFDHIVKLGKVEEHEACRFFQQIISGVEYISKLGIVHRDLKPENMLIDFDRGIKLVDFGLSNTYKDGELLKTACGSPCYAAPEMIAGKRYKGKMVDVWSCGVILFALLAGFLPFEDPNTSNLYKKILAADYKVPDHFSKDAVDLIGRILTTDPEKRIAIEEIKQHRWFNLVRQTLPRAPGTMVGVDCAPIDLNILKQLESH
jgi:5'-AMP-activated protein kinase catalytic alpha subunit